jgi:cytoskeletal protein CcmA (bactofilin family)
MRSAPVSQKGFGYYWSASSKDHALALPSDDLIPLPDLDAPEGVTSIGRTIVVKGEVRSAEHLIIEGCIDGHVLAPKHGVAVGRHGRVTKEILARTITVLGTVRGKLTATERVEILASGRVEGRIVAATVIIDEGAYFTGIVDPTLADTALAVSRHRLKQRDQER